MEKIIKDILSVIPFAIIAILGGVAKLLIDGKKLTIKVFLSSSFVAGFVGAMTAFLLQPFNLPLPAVAFLCGMSGHSAGSILLVYEKKVESFLKKLSLK